MGVGIAFVDIMHIVAGHQLDGAVPAAPIFAKPAVQLVQVGDVVPLQLQEEIVAAKDILIPADLLARGLKIALVCQPRDFCSQAAAGSDETIGVGCQIFFVDARTIIEAIQLGGRGDRQQVLISLHILRQ